MSTSGYQGITLSGLQGSGFGGSTFRDFNGLRSEINAAKNNFGANMIRLQCQQQMLVGREGGKFSPAYLGRIQETVNYVRSQGMTCVINCQTEVGSGKDGNPLPSKASAEFWKAVGPLYGSSDGIIFDIFNEPDGAPSSAGGNWDKWRATMNDLIDAIRKVDHCGSTMLWCDTDSWAQRGFVGCPGLHDPGSNMTYSFHHPPPSEPHTRSAWNRAIGEWANGHRVMNGEWSQNVDEYTWQDPMAAQDYLMWLKDHGIGVTIRTNTEPFFDIFDGSLRPHGWFGYMVAKYFGGVSGGQKILVPDWTENFRLKHDDRAKSLDHMYQGWNDNAGSIIVSAAGFHNKINDVGGSFQRVHVAFLCDNAKATTATVVGGVHNANDKPDHESGLHATLNRGQMDGVKDQGFYSVTLDTSVNGGLANGTHRGITFGIDDKANRYQCRLSKVQLVVDHS